MRNKSYINLLGLQIVLYHLMLPQIMQQRLQQLIQNFTFQLLLHQLLRQLKSDFKRTINWNKYQSKVSTQTKNQYLDYLVSQSKYLRSKYTFCVII